MEAAHRDIQAVIFDKDGTLVDFHSTWDDTLSRTLDLLLGDDPAALALVATGLGFDLITGTIAPDAPFVAASGAELMRIVSPFVDPVQFESVLITEGIQSAQPSDGAYEVLSELRRREIRIGVATNDAQESAVSQFARLGWDGLFDVILGYDSGYTSKPSPKMITGCCQLLGVEVRHAILVGDTATDMRAAKAAGVYAVAIGDDPSASSLADHQIDTMADVLDLLG